VTAVVPVDEYITEEWYPGFRPGDRRAPFVVEPFGTFTKADEQRFWFLDFHWPRGLTPLGLIWNEEGYSWGSQLAAEQLPLPPGRGITQRIAGTHTYASAIGVEAEGEVRDRAARLRGERRADLQRDVEKCTGPEKGNGADQARQEDSFHDWSPPWLTNDSLVGISNGAHRAAGLDGTQFYRASEAKIRESARSARKK